MNAYVRRGLGYRTDTAAGIFDTDKGRPADVSAPT